MFNPVTNAVQLTMYFEGLDQGWSEKVDLGDISLASALTAGASFVNYRLTFLPSGCFLKYAKVSSKGKPADSKMIVKNYPVAGEWDGTDLAVPDDTDAQHYPSQANDALQVRFETDDGKSSNRFIHGIPDAVAVADELLTTVADTGIAPVALATVQAMNTWAARVNEYLALLRTSGQLFRQRVIGAVTVMQTSPIERVIYRQLGSRKTGRPFGISAGRARPR